MISCLHFDLELATVDGCVLAVTFMLHRKDIGAKFADHVADFRELSGLIGEQYGYLAVTTALYKTTGDHAIEGCHVDVTAGYETNDFLSFDGDLVEHCSGNGYCSGTFGNEFLLLDERENRSRNFIVADSYNLIDIC